jgi:hypothetical protein
MYGVFRGRVKRFRNLDASVIPSGGIHLLRKVAGLPEFAKAFLDLSIMLHKRYQLQRVLKSIQSAISCIRDRGVGFHHQMSKELTGSPDEYCNSSKISLSRFFIKNRSSGFVSTRNFPKKECVLGVHVRYQMSKPPSRGPISVTEILSFTRQAIYLANPLCRSRLLITKGNGQ